MKNIIRIMVSGSSTYNAIVYGKEGEVLDEYGNSSIEIVIAVAKKMQDIFKIKDIMSDMDVLEKVLREE